LLYPFKPPAEINKIVLDSLNQRFAHFHLLRFLLSQPAGLVSKRCTWPRNQTNHSGSLLWRFGLAIQKRPPMAEGIPM